jgi:hypothetical protein
MTILATVAKLEVEARRKRGYAGTPALIVADRNLDINFA